MDAAGVLSRLVVHDLALPESTRVELIVHRAALNWRQRHRSIDDKLGNLTTGLAHPGPFIGKLITIGQLEHALAALDGQIAHSDVVSATSRVFDAANRFVGHLAIMNLHTDEFDDLDVLIDAVRTTANGTPGYLLATGRFYHYYGRRLLATQEWLKFLAQFLMPCMLVSPRYVGHSLFSGFCAVRLTGAAPHKPMVPTLVSTV